MLNYHEMTMDEPKDSPQKRKQFLVTCTIMGGVLLYMVVTSGALQAVEPMEGKFPGGNYVYKYTARDYAASGGLGRQIMDDLINAQVAQEKEFTPRFKLEENVHHLYFDNPTGKGGGRQRFTSGVLIAKSKQDTDETIDILLGLNDDTKRTEFTKDELHEKSAAEIFDLLPYETTELPSANALVLQFPWTGGVSSMLVHTMKIIPKMHKLAAEKLDGQQTIVISACSKDEQMCTHYAPLTNVEDYLLGRPTSKEFNDGLGKEQMVDWKGVGLTLEYGKVKIKEWSGWSKKPTPAAGEESKEEL